MRYESLGLYERILIKNLLIERIRKLQQDGLGPAGLQLAYNAYSQLRGADDIVIVRKDK